MAAALGTVVLVLVLASSALAHPSLLSSSPAPGQVLRGAPGQLQLAFTEGVGLAGSSLRVTGPRGRIPTGALFAPPGVPGIAARLPGSLAGGVYSVRWVVLGDDGHTVSGTFRFAVALRGGALPAGAARLAGSDPGGRGAERADGEGVLTVAMRWLSILSASLLLGAAVLQRRLRRRLGPEQIAYVATGLTRVRRRAMVLGVLAAAELVVVAATAGAGSEVRLALLTSSTTGAMALARLSALMLAVAVIAVRRGRSSAGVLAVAGTIVLLSHALDGHTAALGQGRLGASLVQAAHVLAVGVWVGGLLALASTVVFARRTPGRMALTAAAFRAFAPIAAAGAVVVLASGIVSAVREVDAWYFLRWSDYGRVVIAKSASWLVLAAFGAVALLLVRRGRPATGHLIRAEAIGMGVVLALASVLAGLVQGRGQPLPAQRGSLLAGAAFGNSAVGRSLARITVAPALPGPNRVTAVLGPLDLGNPQPRPGRVSVRLSCPCTRRPIDVALRPTPGGGWRAAVVLPQKGLWELRVRVGEDRSLSAMPVVVGEDRSPGAPPLVVLTTADLSGRDAERCRSHALGVMLALAGGNVAGGRAGGRKLVQRLFDDGGSPRRAQALVQRSGDAIALVAPCGTGARGALRGAAGRLPAIVADPGVPVIRRAGLYRLAPDGRTEGTALGQIVRTAGLQAFPGAPRRVAVLAPRGGHGDAVVAGLRGALAGAGVVVVERRYEGVPLRSRVRAAIDGKRFIATYLDGDEAALARDLAGIGRREHRIVPSTIFASARLFSERFQVDSGLLGRIGSLRAVGEVSPVARDAIGYSNLARGLYSGERPTISGLRGYTAGKALLTGLAGGADGDDLGRRLTGAGRFSDAVASGWPASRPWQGSGLVGFFLPSFLPSGLIRPDQGGQEFMGSYFQDGSWKPLTTSLYGPRAVIRQSGPGTTLNRTP